MGTSAHPRACPCPPRPSPAAPIARSCFVPRCPVPALYPHPRQKNTRNLPAPSVFVPAIYPHPTSRVPARYPHPLLHPRPCVFVPSAPVARCYPATRAALRPCIPAPRATRVPVTLPAPASCPSPWHPRPAASPSPCVFVPAVPVARALPAPVAIPAPVPCPPPWHPPPMRRPRPLPYPHPCPARPQGTRRPCATRTRDSTRTRTCPVPVAPAARTVPAPVHCPAIAADQKKEQLVLSNGTSVASAEFGQFSFGRKPLTGGHSRSSWWCKGVVGGRRPPLLRAGGAAWRHSLREKYDSRTSAAASTSRARSGQARRRPIATACLRLLSSSRPRTIASTHARQGRRCGCSRWRTSTPMRSLRKRSPTSGCSPRSGTTTRRRTRSVIVCM